MSLVAKHQHTSAQVRFDNVSVHYLDKPKWLGGKPHYALDEVNLQVEMENLAIVGPSGAGKSTIVELLFGLKKPTHGEVYICDQPISTSTVHERRQLCQHIQLIPQEPQATLNPYYTVEQVIAEPLNNQQTQPSLTQSKVREVLAEVGLSEALLARNPSQLSVGQAQRVAIARALILEPCVLVADEPTSSLDPISRQKVIALLRSLQQRHHMRLILITHDLNAAKSLCEQVIVLEHGKVVESGLAQQVLGQPQHRVTQALLGSSAHYN